MEDDAVTKTQRSNAMEPQYAKGMAKSHVHSIISASANPPSSGPTFSDLTGLYPFGSSSLSSSDIQPSEIFGVLSVESGNAFDWSFADIFASTSWYRNNRAS